jgi:hypothetical protein
MNSIDRMTDIISNRLLSIENELKGDVSEDYKKHLGIEQAIFRRLKGILDWEALSPIDKQASRISTLASIRKSGANEKSILHQEFVINIYGLITMTLPYIKVINLNNKLDKLEALCNAELQIIDSSGSDFRGKHVAKEEIETAFAFYFEKVQPHKMNMYKECYEKIEVLHMAFKGLLD